MLLTLVTLVTLALAGSLFSSIGIGIVPFIALVGIVGISIRGIVACVNLMIAGSAQFFGITRESALRLHLMIGAVLLFPPSLPFMLMIAFATFRDSHVRPAN